MNALTNKWFNSPSALRYGGLIGLGAVVALLVGVDWKVVAGFIVAMIAIRVIDAGAKSRPLLGIRTPFENDAHVKQLPPLPFDAVAIVAAEVDECEALRAAQRRLPRTMRALAFEQSGPSKYADAKFKAAVTEFAGELETWLEEYAEAADRRYRTFHLPISVVNEARSAAAENVRLTVRLGPDARFVDRPEAIKAPPEPPDYNSIQSSYGRDILRMSNLAALASRHAYPVIPGLRGPEWHISKDGRTATFDLPRLHCKEAIEIEDDLFVLLRSRGEQVATWTISSTAGPVRREGELTFRCAEPETVGRGITRLAGLLAYPDVDIEGEDSEGDVLARRENPPISLPAPEGDDTISALRAMAQRNRIEALGLPVAEHLPAGADVD